MASPFRLYIPVFSATLVLSAFLLFGVQPMFGKMILPLLGGSPQVWNTAMLFFQAMLLGGYAYAHLSSRFLTVRQQALVHVILLFLCVFFLPIAIPANWPAPDSNHPIVWQLALMATVAGAPFFVLAGSAPMLQRWFSQTSHPDADNPYFLYAASNFGSMAALLGYSTMIEPALTIQQQTMGWAGGFVLLIAMVGLSALIVACTHNPAFRTAAASQKPAARLPRSLKLQWLILAFLPSSLMLGVTTYITTDLAAVPLLWIIPLALYVGTFIIAFSRRLAIPPRILLILYSVFLLFILSMTFQNFPIGKIYVISAHFLLFFFSALLCHTELAALRPPANRLTGYYLVMSMGGVLGGIFNALLAPLIFPLPVEYALILGLVAFIRFYRDPDQSFTLVHVADSLGKGFIPLALIAAAGALAIESPFLVSVRLLLTLISILAMIRLYDNRMAFGVGAMILLACNPGTPWDRVNKLLVLERNFFGVTAVKDNEAGTMRLLMHGTTLHGEQPLISPWQFVPMSYYHPQGPAGDAFGILQNRATPQRIAALGLGVGSIACYVKAGRHFDFYEIDPIVPKVAQDPKLFTYLSGCGSPYSIIMGDGRLNIAKAPDRSYDMIFLDAFSSDNIPVHLVTNEAFQLYRRKLKPDGIIAANISNRFLNLEPVMNAAGKASGMAVLFKMGPVIHVRDPDIYASASIYAVFVNDPADIAFFTRAGWKPFDGKPVRPWTDNYSNPFGTLWHQLPKMPKN